MAKRLTQDDLEIIGKDYALGQKTVRTIAGEHGVSHTTIMNWAKKLHWVRDKSDEVRQKTKAGLISCQDKVAKEVAKKVATPTNEDIEKAVQANITIIRGHQKRLATLGNHVKEIFTMLDEIPKDATIQNMRARAVTVKDLSSTLKNLIPLERQAFNLDDGRVSLEEVLNALPADISEAVRREFSQIIS